MNVEHAKDNVDVSHKLLKEDIPEQELLGSVTTYSSLDGTDSKNQQLRSSARVFKKIKLDATVESTPATTERTDKKEEAKPDQKKCLRPIWSSDDKNLFFEGLNEFGKDFESIHAYLATKLKKKGIPESLIKTKDQIRHLYYRTWHKISKYLKFSEGISKVVKEMYSLINFGELRKKVGTLTHKICAKLNELIYNGFVAVRIKGKTVRIKTPMCRALRRLNQLDDKYDELKLPTRVLLELRPKDMNSFLKVQNMALNPRIRSSLPLQKRLSTFITCVCKRWKAAEVEYFKKECSWKPNGSLDAAEEIPSLNECLVTPSLRFSPPKEINIEAPAINLSEYFTRQSICLKAYEDRIGIPTSEYILSLLHDKRDVQRKVGQKSRSDSISETEKSPNKGDTNSNDQDPWTDMENAALTDNEAAPSDGNPGKIVKNAVDEAVNTILLLQTNEPKNETNLDEVEFYQNGCSAEEGVQTENIKIETDETLKHTQLQIEKVRSGWTIDDCESLTIGELYLMFGSNSKLILEYSWLEKHEEKDFTSLSLSECLKEELNSSSNSMKDLTNHFSLTHSLRKLLSVAKLHYRRNIIKCPCGHICSPKNSVIKKSLEAKCNNKAITHDNQDPDVKLEESVFDAEASLVATTVEEPKYSGGDEVFRQPSQPPVHLMAQLDSIQKLKPKYCIRKGRRLRTKPVVVERKLPLLPHKTSSAHQIVRMNIISQTESTEINSASQTVLMTEENDMDFEEAENPTDNICSDVNFLQHISDETCDNNPVNIIKRLGSEMDITCNVNLDGNENLSVLLQGSSRSTSPSRILKENDSQWINSEVADFSLSSFLGHLESPMKTAQEDSRLSQDVDAQVRSLLTENSFDYTAKFADLANKVVDDKNTT